MEFLKEWTFSVCLSLLAAVIISLFTPKGKMQQFYRLLIAFFVFASFLYPLNGWRATAQSMDTWFSSEPIQAENHTLYEDAVNRQIRQVLESHGIIGASVQCRLQADYTTGEITVNEVQIAVPDEYDLTQVEALIFETLGLSVRVIRLGE